MPFFTITKSPSGTYQLSSPNGSPTISIGINHIDESSLQYPHNISIHTSRYPTRRSFIQAVTSRLRSPHFNTLGWTPEYVAGHSSDPKLGLIADIFHGTGWSEHELRECGMPYFVSLPVMQIQDWNANPVFRDPGSVEFREWCEYLTRSVCAVHWESELCVGYFFVDIPAWGRHPSGLNFPAVEGMGREEREERIYDVAKVYYSTVCEAARKMDPNHLIFGDRYNGNTDIPGGVLRAMKEHVDVLSVQYFCEPSFDNAAREVMLSRLRTRQAEVDKPVLIADIGNYCATKMNSHRASSLTSQRERGLEYEETVRALAKERWCIGWHWCGYIESISGGGWGIVDPWDEECSDMTLRIKECNQEIQKRMSMS